MKLFALCAVCVVGLVACGSTTSTSTTSSGGSTGGQSGSGTSGGTSSSGGGSTGSSGTSGGSSTGGTTGPVFAACASAYAGCSSFEDRSGAAANRTITFTSNSYTPQCIRVAVGQTVTFSGSFSSHPLEGACGPSEVIADQSSGSSYTASFATAGTYGYFCTRHGTRSGSGMAGAIEVIAAP